MGRYLCVCVSEMELLLAGYNQARLVVHFAKEHFVLI